MKRLQHAGRFSVRIPRAILKESIKNNATLSESLILEEISGNLPQSLKAEFNSETSEAIPEEKFKRNHWRDFL